MIQRRQQQIRGEERSLCLVLFGDLDPVDPVDPLLRGNCTFRALLEGFGSELVRVWLGVSIALPYLQQYGLLQLAINRVLILI